jgi:hypothetical protein
MTRGKQPPPPWIGNGRKQLAFVRRNLNTARAEARKDIKRSLEGMKAVDALDKEAAYMQAVLDRDYADEAYADENIQATGTVLARAIAHLEERTSSLAEVSVIAGVAAEGMHERFLNVLPASDTVSASGVFITAAIQTRFYAINESPNEPPSVPQPDRVQSRLELHTALRDMLSHLDPAFVEMLDGSETALQAGFPDSLSQAAHSMRDLYEQVIETLAPSEVVSQQPWFAPTPEARGRVFQKIRLKFILPGPITQVDDTLIDQLDEEAGAAKDILDLCIARAHDPSLSKEEATLAIDQARHSLLSVL